MGGQPEIQSFYRDIHERLKVALFQCYGSHISLLDRATSLDKYDHELVFIYKTILFDKKIELAIVVPWNFPAVFPNLFIHATEDKSFLNFPHIDTKSFICTFDKGAALPNTEMPVQVVQAVVERGIQIIRDGFYNHSNDLFLEEFNAYWSLDLEAAVILYTDFAPSKMIQELYLFTKKYDQSVLGYVFQNKETFSLFCRNTEINKEDFASRKILYIPFMEVSVNPKINTISEIKSIINNLKFSKLNHYINSIYNQKQSYNIFLSSIQAANGFVLFSWEPIFQPIMKRNGFRRGLIPFVHAVFELQQSNKIRKYRVERIDKNRLFSRIGTHIHSLFDKKIHIAGLGSIGSHLAMSLSKSGFSNFILVDNENLDTGNIARHLCGFSYINKSKADGVRNVLGQHFPFIHATPIKKDILKVISNDQNSIKDSALHIICIGNTNIEIAIDKFLIGNLLFLWVEPFSFICHGVYIPEQSKIRFKDFFTTDFQYKFQAILASEKYLKREAGCQNTFIPYSYNSFEIFIALVSNQVRIILENPSKLKAFTWIGDATEYVNLNIQISQIYKDRKMEFLIHERPAMEAITANESNI